MKAVPNILLRQARLRLRHPDRPDRPMTLADVVDAVNTVIYGDDQEKKKVSAFNVNYLRKLERGIIARPRTAEYIAALRTVLQVKSDEEIGFAPARDATPPRARGHTRQGSASTGALPAGRRRAGVASDPMRRRNVLAWGAATAAAGAGLPVFGASLEAARHSLDLAAAEERSQATIEEWREIVWEHAFRYMITPPADMLDALSIDMMSVRSALAVDHDSRTFTELRRAAAMLAVFTAMTVANLGDIRHGRRWWRTAKRLADQSRDPSTIIWVRGREIVRAPYEQFPLAAVLELVRQADALADAAPDAAKPEYISGKAQALAMAGHAQPARQALRQAQAVFDNLPEEITTNTGSLLGWPADRMLFTTSFVHSHLGDYSRARAAQREAIAAYPPGTVRGPAQIELQHALCLAKTGDTDTAVQHAQDVVTRLPVDDRIRPVLDLAQRVHAALPVGRRPAADEYRQFLDLIDLPGGTAR